MRKAALTILAAVVLLAGASFADTVYTRDGKTYSGTVTRDGDTVRVQTSGGVVELKAADVLYVKKDTPAVPTPGGLPTPPPDDTVGSTDGAADRKIPTGSIRPDRIIFDMHGTIYPDSVVFMLMRNLRASSSGAASLDLRKQIEQWQVLAHERKRRVAGKWYTPKDFINRRNSYIQGLKDAAEFSRGVSRYTTARTAAEEAKRQRIAEQLNKKLIEVSRRWPDPLIRQFLGGIAYLRAENNHQALLLFQTCCKQAPRVAGFYQGYGLALMASNRETDALEAYLALMELLPDSRDALNLLCKGIAALPGIALKTDLYARATQVRDLYDTTAKSSSSSWGMKWLMPGKKTWTDRGSTLPTPPYDRLVFKQCVGVPVAPGILLADESVVRDAAAVYVQIAGKGIVKGRVQRTMYYGSKTAERPPLTLVNVAEYDFTPATDIVDTKSPLPTFKAGTDVHIYGMGVLEEMGSDVRRVPAKIVSASENGAVELRGRLSAGDAAAPVLTLDGKLVAFMAAKTDVAADDGGPDRLIPLSALTPLIVKAAKAKRTSSSYGGYSSAKRKPITPQAVKDRIVTIHAIHEETFKE